MTSVPKPLKFLRPHYGTLKKFYENMPDGENKVWVIHKNIQCLRKRDSGFYLIWSK
jgi:hypothetical protein